MGGVAFFRNITERKLAERALEDLSVRDPLTNLYNRRYFNKRIEEEISRATRQESRFALLLCDLDNFKKVNDTRSHQFGDEILKAAGQAIQEATRDVDFVFRWGGDEFVVILLVDVRQGITDTGERIRERIIALGKEKRFPLDLSIGVALFPEHGEDSNQLIRLADRALYIAKKRGDKIHIGEEEYELDDGVVDVVFQPIMDTVLGQVVGHEALSRSSTEEFGIQELFRKYRSIGRLLELKEICFRKQIETAEAHELNRVFINVDFKLLEYPWPPKEAGHCRGHTGDLGKGGPDRYRAPSRRGPSNGEQRDSNSRSMTSVWASFPFRSSPTWSRSTSSWTASRSCRPWRPRSFGNS